jgi:hypothetical protein
MEPLHSESLVAAIAGLAELDKQHLALGQQMLEAFGGALYGMDLLAVGALNRSTAHIAGFRHLVDAKNLICAGALLRLQLDTAMRFYAAWLVADPHEFALAVLRGDKVRNIKDRDGKKLTDTYLTERLGQEFPWVPRVYESTSGYVHLSATHLIGAMTTADRQSGDDRSFTVKISPDDKPLPDWIYIEAVDAFRAATDILLRYVEGWVFTKANPELVQKW